MKSITTRSLIEWTVYIDSTSIPGYSLIFKNYLSSQFEEVCGCGIQTKDHWWLGYTWSDNGPVVEDGSSANVGRRGLKTLDRDLGQDLRLGLG